MRELLIIICLLISLTSFAQTTIRKVIVDAETNLPISNAHVYGLDQYKSGTISNLDGRFVMKLQGDDTLCISHITYRPTMVGTAKLHSDTIFLQKNQETIQEVLVHAISGKDILRKVIENLEKNHAVEPQMYKAFVRVSQFEEDQSELHELSEYVLNMYQMENHKSMVQVLKARSQPFSEEGKKSFKHTFLMHAATISIDNVFCQKENVLKKSKLRKYDVDVTNKIVVNGQHCTELTCKQKRNKNSKSYVLLINNADYAIRKLSTYYDRKLDRVGHIEFKQIKGKWYLHSSRYSTKSDYYTKWNPDSESIFQKEVVYNIDSAEYKPEQYSTPFSLIAKDSKSYIEDWSDSYWEDYNYIVLPVWIQRIVREQIAGKN